MRASNLPLPHLAERVFEGISVLTDDALAETLGVRIAFSGRAGGASASPYDSLNLGSHVGDDPRDVDANRAALARVLGAEGAPLVVPNQVHGTNIVTIDDAGAASIDAASRAAADGADALIVGAANVAAMLCFADCVPVVLVSPVGSFAVVHAGWRGAVAGIAGAALRALSRHDADAVGGGREEAAALAAATNAYIGPCIRRECFETGPDVRARFADAFGEECLFGDANVDLPRAVSIDLARAGADERRIADAGICTVCAQDRYFSYRASGGTCGRHAAFAVRKEAVS